MNINKSPIQNPYKEEEKRMIPGTVVNQPRFSNNNGSTNLNQSRTRMSSIQEMYTPIRVLNQFSTDWKIRARVTKKGEEKQWRNNKGEGVLMNIDLIDKEGTQI
jgi:replication factor A1